MTYPKIDYFLCDYEEVLRRIDAIDPRSYDSTRNYLNGSVTWLSPFVSHGIIDTSLVAHRLLNRYSAEQCNRFLFELAWREYFHRVWQQSGNGIFENIRVQADLQQDEVLNLNPPAALMSGQTGIEVIDECITHLMTNGVMHNHARMWTASLACNIGKSHWQAPAKWMHYHLLDGDLASNSLSWQWVAGTFSNKRYIANQDNINKYSGHVQRATFLDHSYEALATSSIPTNFSERSELKYDLNIPANDLAISGNSLAVRSLWNLDPTWQPSVDQKILFVDVNHYQHWPMSSNRWRFIQHWTSFIPELEIMCGTIDELKQASSGKNVYCREYPLTSAWFDELEPRNWLYHNPEKAFNSFFAFWKQVKRDVGL